jgi:NADH-ubiquinone oxidoreductase chain 5
MLVNRVGDFGLALGVMGVFSLFKSINFSTVFACASQQAPTFFVFCNQELHALTTICILLFVGAVGKSAQLGLHTWLPDAMEGPTPVSALIHAATMVTAGVFMIARCSPLFELAPAALMVVTFVGAMTVFFAATTGLVQNDLKRVIAYSTCSQLGYMIFACGISNYSVGVFHLMNHAFFKALLFLSAGSVIHALSDEQDMRKMGGVVKLLPFTYAMMICGSLSLTGFPFLTGYYSKDLVLELAYATYTISGNFAYWLGSICVALTSYYSFRLVFLTFLAPVTAYKKSIQKVHDAPFLMAFPLLVLSFGSIFVGYFAKDMMVGVGTQFWGNSIFILPKSTTLIESEYIPQANKFLPLVFTLGGAMAALLINFSRADLAYIIKTSFLGKTIYTFLNKRWLFDKVTNDYIAQKCLSFGYHVSFKTLDKGVFELIGPHGISDLFKQLTASISQLQTGMIYHYAVVMLLGLTLLITMVGAYGVMELFIDKRLYFLFLTTFVLKAVLSNKA